MGPIINISSVSPATAVQNPAAAKGALSAGPASPLDQALQTAANPNSGNDLAAGNQFANLITPGVKSTKALIALPDPAEQVTPQGDAKTAPQANNGIAIPLYIDQPIAANLPKADDTISVAADAVGGNLNNKQPIFSPQLAPAAGKTAVVASEVADKELDEEVAGKIPLQQLSKATEAQDPEFTKAVANIVSQAKTKDLKVASNNEQTVVQKLAPVAEKTADTNQVAKASDASQQQLANAKEATDPNSVLTKVTAKVVAVKSEVVASDDSDETATPAVTANLQDFAAQLKTKSFSSVTAAHQALAQTPADQVKIQISQAMTSGTNSIKIHLHPVELGLVDVDMDTDHEGNTKISITADKADTLAMLKTDSHNLTKTLAEAGIKTDNATMQFNLRGDSQNQQQCDFGSNGFQQNNNGNNSAQQQANNMVGSRSAYTNLNEHTLTLSANKGLNILV